MANLFRSPSLNQTRLKPVKPKRVTPNESPLQGLGISHLLDLARLRGKNDDRLLPQDGEGQTVIGQEHVGPDDRQINLVLPQGLGALPHVFEWDHIQPDVSPGMGERLGEGVNQTSLDTVPWTNRDRKPGG